MDGPWQDPKRTVNPPQIDSESIFKIIRRNWQNAGLVFFVTLALGVTLSFFVKNSYRSKVVASFSRTDSAVMSLEGGMAVGADRSDWNFETRMTDPYFLSKLGDFSCL